VLNSKTGPFVLEMNVNFSKKAKTQGKMFFTFADNY